LEFSKWIVMGIVLLNAFFTIGVLFVFLRVGSEPTVLIGAWFAFTTGELWMLSGIKKDKVKAETRQIISGCQNTEKEGGKNCESNNIPL